MEENSTRLVYSNNYTVGILLQYLYTCIALSATDSTGTGTRYLIL